VSQKRSGRDGIGVSTAGDIESLMCGHADKAVVLDGDDPQCNDLAKRVESASVCYVSMDPGIDPVRAHLAAGGDAVFLEREGTDKWIVVHEAGEPRRLMRAGDLSFADNEKYLRASLFVVAMARALGIAEETIVSALTDYRPEPGRASSSPEVLSF
jgi:cyanophycin synthetase